MSGAKTLVCMVGVWTLCRAASAAAPDSAANPYQGIVDRNVFGLKPPPPPEDPEANKPPPPKIFLTGITTILGNKRALLKMTPPAKPGEPAKEQCFTLGEGQRDGELEVLEIDEKAGTVKVNEYGTVATLDFESNGVKAATAPMPGAPPNAPRSLPVPAGLPQMPAGGGSPFARPMRRPAPGAVSGVSPAAGGASPMSASSALNSMPLTSAYGSPAVTLPGFAAGTTQTQPAVTPATAAGSDTGGAAAREQKQIISTGPATYCAVDWGARQFGLSHHADANRGPTAASALTAPVAAAVTLAG